MQYRFSKLGFLNDFDMQITAKLDLGIYESLPFEKVDFKTNLLNGKLEIERLSINSGCQRADGVWRCNKRFRQCSRL
ncbi:MAG: hypothetical protein ACLU99_09925 [Alphaproteobacteria bacterium]